jgi:hypothetical protein
MAHFLTITVIRENGACYPDTVPWMGIDPNISAEFPTHMISSTNIVHNQAKK